MPTLNSSLHSESTQRPKVLTGLVKDSLIPPKFRNIWVLDILLWDFDHDMVSRSIVTKDQQVINQAVQFGFNCESAYPKGKKPEEGYSHVELFDKFCTGENAQFQWPEEDGVVSDFAGFEVYFYDMNGTKTSVVINYKD